MKVFPEFVEFAAAARHGNLVPVCAERLADLLTPVGAYLRVAAHLQRPFLLESAEGGERVGRFSFIGGDPFLEVFGDAEGIFLQEPGQQRERVAGDPMAALADLQGRFRAPRVPGAPPFAGGAVGYVGYDAVRWVEEIPARSTAEPWPPWLYLAYYDTVLAFDHLRHRVILVANARIEDADDDAGLRASYERALERLGHLSGLLEGEPLPAAPLDAATDATRSSLAVNANMDRQAFCSAVAVAKDYIGAGDAFQIVLSRRLICPTVAAPISVYRALRAINPSPYMFVLDTDGGQIVGSSPEMLVRVQEGVVETRPIAGTRRRGGDHDEDQLLEAQLLADEKERAEHLMLVDLGRNDVGRVARFGSVEVPEFMHVERYSHVMHLVSSVRGRLREEVSPIEAFFASFPAGTVSGAPKIRAMQIIEEMEPTLRGVYAGAILYCDFAGNIDSCIAIRTIVMRNGKASVQAGAGIVADSDPDREFEETEQKAAASLQALAWADSAERGAIEGGESG
jgi:anthranilate synthase component 1